MLDVNSKKKKVLALYRTSTRKQDISIEVQKEILEREAERRNWEIVKEVEERVSGAREKKADRDRLINLCKFARSQGMTIAIAKIDRLAREQFLFQQLKQTQCEFFFADFPDLTGPMAGLILEIMVAVAAHELKLIRSRTKAAMEQIKKEGKQKLGAAREHMFSLSKKSFGMPLKPVKKFTREEIMVAQKLGSKANAVKAKENWEPLLPEILELRKQKLTYSECARIMNERQRVTPAGKGKFYPAQIRRALKYWGYKDVA